MKLLVEEPKRNPIILPRGVLRSALRSNPDAYPVMEKVKIISEQIKKAAKHTVEAFQSVAHRGFPYLHVIYCHLADIVYFHFGDISRYSMQVCSRHVG